MIFEESKEVKVLVMREKDGMLTDLEEIDNDTSRG
jgi:hypothetical protein